MKGWKKQKKVRESIRCVVCDDPAAAREDQWWESKWIAWLTTLYYQYSMDLYPQCVNNGDRKLREKKIKEEGNDSTRNLSLSSPPSPWK